MRRFFLSVTVVVAAVAWISGDVAAQTVHAETVTIGKGTNFRRSDFSVEAQRLVLQSVSVRGWDVVPVLPGDTQAAISGRFYNDFTLRAATEQPYEALDQGRFVVDHAYFTYRPFERVRWTLGRQWVGSALGVRDIDGVRLRLEPQLSPAIASHVETWVGSDVATRWATTSPDTWDVQGLPIELDGPRTAGTRLGASAGIRWSEAAASITWDRSQRGGDDGFVVGDERVGAAIRGNVAPRLALSSFASFHTLLQDVDRAAIDLAWRAPWDEAVLSGGVEHRQPWFDSASIFNVFGARPFEEARLTYQHPVGEIATSFDARAWGRAYDGNLDLSDFGSGVGDARALGGGLGHSTRFRAFGRVFEWRTFGSTEVSPDRAQGGERWVGDVRFRFPAIERRLYLTGRFLGLAWASGATASRSTAATAATGAFVAEAPVSFGRFELALHGTRSSAFEPTFNAWASFETDLWF